MTVRWIALAASVISLAVVVWNARQTRKHYARARAAYRQTFATLYLAAVYQSRAQYYWRQRQEILNRRRR